MYTLLREIYVKYCGYPQYNVAILGLEETGKSQILKALKDETSPYLVGLKQQYRPTVGLNTTKVQRARMSFLVWDLGGKQSIRKIWDNYYPYCHGVIFVFDARVDEGLDCLRSVLGHSEMVRVPVLVFVRNSELYTQVQAQLQKLHDSECMQGRGMSIQLLPHSRARLHEHLQWLYDQIHKLDVDIRR